MAMQMAFDYDLDRPLFVNPTHQFSRQGLDNPDAIYFNAYLREGVEYVVRGRRGTSADLSFQVMGGTYSADSAADLADGLRRPRAREGRRRQLRVHLRGRARRQDDDRPRGLQRLGHRGARHAHHRAAPTPLGQPAKPLHRGDARARSTRSPPRSLVGSIQTWFAFPHFFQYKEPVNTLTAPQSTPGGLASQRSSIGHYELADDEALVITVPECTDCAYQAIQIGSDWYASTDYETHQTSLTKAQAVTDPDGKYAVRGLGALACGTGTAIANWLETTGHRTGAMMLRWQRLERDLGPEDGPTVEMVKLADVPGLLPHFTPLTTEEYAARIAARQRSVARRMIS